MLVVTKMLVVSGLDGPAKGECRAPEVWAILRLVFLKKLDAKFEKGQRDFETYRIFDRWKNLCLGQLGSESAPH